MNRPQTAPPTTQRSLRLWPGVVLVLLQWLGRSVLPMLGSVAGMIGAMGSLLCWVLILVWWAFFSRAPRAERWSGTVLMAAGVVAARLLVHESIATAGMGVSFFIYIAPVLSFAFVLWTLLGTRLPGGLRRLSLIGAILLACGVWPLLRMDGITGDGASDFAWRWAATAEERLLAESTEALVPGVEIAVAAGDPAWPGFRGARRDSVIRGVRIETDWTASPPVELWRRPIGPGWSSFGVLGDLLFTQEQRGDDEVVSCYSAATGDPVWRHDDAVRFWESHAGAGPRATPAVADGRVYSFGATGILNALEATDGSVVWSRDATADAATTVPDWGFTSSPLVIDDLVVVHAGVLVAYDRATGEPRWLGPDRGGSYSSPHLVTIDGATQIVMLSAAGATGIAPADGGVLWEHPWGGSIVQPALTADGDLLISGGGLTGGLGIRRVAVAREIGLNVELRGSEGWATEERWTSVRLKPNFSDFVVHGGHAFGFDGRILACIDLADGERCWKGGRYGSGQLVLLADQGLLLVVSEQGELALVDASPDRFTELARLPAVEGKTWNHPVVVDDLLLVRNGQEMVAYRLALATG